MPPSTSKQALDQLYGLQKGRKSATDLLTGSETKLGLPSARQRLSGLRGAISNTENLLRNVDPAVTGRTSGQLVSEGQRQAIVQQEREPLGEQFREQSRALEGESQSLQELSGRALSETQLGMSEQEAKERNLQNIYQSLFGQEQEVARQAEADRQYSLQMRQIEDQAARWREEMAESRRQSAQNRVDPSKWLSQSQSSGGSQPKTDPIQQDAFNDVNTRISSGSDRDILSDYQATLKSANFGNRRDQIKVQLYKQLKPNLFVAGSKGYMGSTGVASAVKFPNAFNMNANPFMR